MKKLLLSLFVTFFAMGVNAQTEVLFDFDSNATELFGIEGRSTNDDNAGDITADAVATVDGVTVTVSPAAEGATTPNRLWYKTPVLRMYSGTFTVEAEQNIAKIAFTSTTKKINLTPDCGTLEDKTWTADNADVKKVVFTVGGNTQINQIVVTLGEAGGDEPIVIAGEGAGTEESPYDVVRALSLIENDQVTTDKVYVKGTIAEIVEVNLNYGNATYYLGQGESKIQVFRGYSLNGEKFTAEDEIKVDDEVVILGFLKDYNGTPEVTNSSIITLNGQGTPEEPEYVPVGNGTFENPYTVTDVQKMKIETSDGEYYWVKGVILGSATSGTKLIDLEKATDTNIALGETAESETFVPCAIPNNGLREQLGVASHPDNIGKEAKVYGTLEKYFSVPGVKNVKQAWIDGMELSGIESVAADNASVKYYNVQGVEVANPQAGQLYIRVQGNKATKVIR